MMMITGDDDDDSCDIGDKAAATAIVREPLRWSAAGFCLQGCHTSQVQVVSHQVV